MSRHTIHTSSVALSRRLRKYVAIATLCIFSLLVMTVNFIYSIPPTESVSNSGPVVKSFNSSTHFIYQTPPELPYRGLVFVAHACTHSAYDFWPKSMSCFDCVGLTEEVAIVKRIIASGFVAVAASSFDRQYKCWQGPEGRDIEVIPSVLQQLRAELNLLQYPIFALGCSSGGPFVWLLAVKGFVDGIIVQSFHIGDQLLKSAEPNAFPVIFNPMPKDKYTYTQVQMNVLALEEMGFTSDHVQLQPCGALEVTLPYMFSRLGHFLSKREIAIILLELTRSGYVDPISSLLVKDPTKDFGAEDWRQILIHRLPQELLSKLDLTRGRSPLAKTLNRAWAFHEYCADYITESLAWLSKNAILGRVNVVM